MNHDDDYDFEEETGPSKSQIKREMKALQELGEKIADLSSSQLASLSLPEELLDAINQARIMKHNEARRRQFRFIGKLLRHADHDAINEQLEQFNKKHHQHVQQHHAAEAWRDRLLEGNNDAVTEFLDRYPQTSAQQLRQLLRSAAKERKDNKPPASARKLFRLVLEQITVQ